MERELSGPRAAAFEDRHLAISVWSFGQLGHAIEPHSTPLLDQQGALGEVEGLAARGLDPALPVMRAHGVPGLIDYLRGDATLAEAIARGQRDTRAYSKRQVTFVRHQLPDFAMVAPEAGWEAMAAML